MSATSVPNLPKSGVVSPAGYDPNVWNQALAQAQAAAQAAQAPLLSQQQASDALYAQKAKDAQSIAAAAAQAMRGLAPDLQGVYQSGAQDDALIGAAQNAALQDAVSGNNAGLNKLLTQIGSPGQIDTHPAAAGAVLQSVGGTNPAQALEAQGAASAGYFAQLPGFQIEKGAQDAYAAQNAGLAAHSDFDQKLAAISASIPGDAQDNYVKLKQLAMQDANFQLQVSKYQTSVDEFNAKQVAAQQKERFAEWAKVQGLKQGQARIQLSYAKMQQSAQQFASRQAQSYYIAMQRLGVAQKSLALRAAAQAYKFANGGFTPTAVNGFNATLQRMHNGLVSAGPTGGLAFKQTATQNIKVNGKTVKKGDTYLVPTDYAHFIAQAVANKVPIQLAIQYANGIWPAGERGNPAELKQLTQLSDAANATQYNTPNQFNSGVGSYPVTQPATKGVQRAAQQYASSQLRKYGWGADEMGALLTLWNNESGWNPNAVNPSSGAAGIAQSLGHGKVPLGNYRAQINWGLNYIKQRYGSPSAALRFWLSNSPHWY